MPFTAKFPGYCGICRMKIRKGDTIEALPSPVLIEGKERYDFQRMQTRQYSVLCRYAHAQCAGTQNWSDFDG